MSEYIGNNIHLSNNASAEKSSKKLQQQIKNPIYLFESEDLAGTFPEWKSPLLSADFTFIQTFKELNLVRKKLAEKEKGAEFFNTEMKSKWEELKKEQLDFLDDVQQYNTFFMENELKCKRISKKIKAETKFRDKCIQETKKLEDRLDYLTNIEKKLEISVNLLEPYHRFLEKIVSNMETFENVSELINYFLVLNSEINLQSKLYSNLFDHELLYTHILRGLKTKTMTLNEQNNSLFCIQKNHDAITNDLKQCEEKQENLKTVLRDETEETIIVQHSCDNIYERLCKWKRIPIINLNYEEKLTFIENAIVEMRRAVQMAHELREKSDMSCKADSSFISTRRII